MTVHNKKVLKTTYFKLFQRKNLKRLKQFCFSSKKKYSKVSKMHVMKYIYNRFLGFYLRKKESIMKKRKLTTNENAMMKKSASCKNLH